MKKLYLLLVMLCMSVGTWAAEAPTVSDDNSSSIFIIISNGAGGIAENISSIKEEGGTPNRYPSYRQNLQISGEINSDDITAINGWTEFGSNVPSPFFVLDLKGASYVSEGTISLSSKWNAVRLAVGADLTSCNGDGLKYAYSSNMTRVLSWADDNEDPKEINLYVKEGGLTAFQSAMSYMCNYRTIYLSGDYTEEELTSLSAITGVTVVVASNEQTSFTITLNGTNSLEDLLTAEDKYDPTTIKSLTIKGDKPLSDVDIAYLKNLSTISTLDLSGVTNASSVELPGGVTDVTVPKGTTVPAVNYAQAENLKYIFSAASDNYPNTVQIVKEGGFAEAVTAHDVLKTGKVKIIGTVGAEDVKFNTLLTQETAKTIDLSNAKLSEINIGTDILLPGNNNGTYSTNFILPTTTDLTTFSYISNDLAYIMKLSADGSTLEVAPCGMTPSALKLDAATLNGATAVAFVKNTANNRKIKQGVIDVVNQADASLTTVDLSGWNVAGDFEVTDNVITITNQNLTSIDLSSSLIGGLDVSDLSKLTELDLSGATIGTNVNAKNATALIEINLDNTNFTQTVDVSNEEGTINVTRESADYSNLSIVCDNDFETTRVIPVVTTLTTDKQYAFDNFTQELEITVDLNCDAESKLQAAVNNYNSTHSTKAKVKHITTLTVTGTVSDDDIAYIHNNLPNLKLVDLKDAASAAGSNLIAKSVEFENTTAIILPSTVTKQELSSYQNNVKTMAYWDGNNLNLFSVTSAVANYSKVLDETKGVFFLPTYDGEGEITTNYQHIDKEAFGKLEAVSVDLTWANASDIIDCTFLNAKTHYIFIPQNPASYSAEQDFTNESSNYKYNDNIWVVSTYKGTDSPYATGVVFGGQFLRTGPTLDGYEGINQTTVVTYVRKDGTMLDAYHLARAEVKSPQRLIVVGKLGKLDGEDKTSDVKAIGMLGSATHLDLSQATVDGTASITDLDADQAQYIALPKGTSEDEVKAVAAKCDKLKGVGNAITDTKFFGLSNEPGSLIDVTQMIEERAYTDVKLAGILNAQDIATGTISHNLYNGSRSSGDTDAVAASVSGAFYGAAISSIDLDECAFIRQDDMCFSQLGYDHTLTSVKFPTAKVSYKGDDYQQTEIPAQCLLGTASSATISTICIPYNYQYIRKSAFENRMSTTHIYTIDANGNPVNSDAEEYANSITFSENLRLIEQNAFALTKDIKDVYVLCDGSKGFYTQCQKDAFDGITYCGINGFAGEVHPISRNNYKNTDWIAVLHYPESLIGKEGEWYYTDPTRKYTLKDELNTTNDRGELLTWPTQYEFGQAEACAVTGCLYEEITEGTYGSDLKTISYVEGNNHAKYHSDQTGWYQFVLTNNTVSTTTNWDFSKYNSNHWYTICLPFDVTKEKLVEIFGSGTQVSRFIGVSRTWNTQDTEGLIQLQFSSDIAEEKTDKDVVMYGQYAYMIKPGRTTGAIQDAGNAGLYAVDLTKITATNYLPEYTKNDGAGNSYQFLSDKVKTYQYGSSSYTQISSDLNVEKVKQYTYSFIGNYEARDKKIPVNSYFWATADGENYQFYRASGSGNKWSPYTAIIAIVESVTQEQHLDANQHIVDQLELNYVMTNDRFTSEEQSNTTANVVTRNADAFTTFVNADESATEIENVEILIDGVNVNDYDDKVYSIQGQYVGNSLNGLSKGIYIVNGRKYIIK